MIEACIAIGPVCLVVGIVLGWRMKGGLDPLPRMIPAIRFPKKTPESFKVPQQEKF